MIFLVFIKFNLLFMALTANVARLMLCFLVYSQQEMCVAYLFNQIHSILSTEDQDIRLLRTTCYLITAVVANNSKNDDKHCPHMHVHTQTLNGKYLYNSYTVPVTVI